MQAINNYQKERQFQALNDEAEGKKTIKIIRDGVTAEHKLNACQVGDIVQVESGMEIPGDGILIQGFSVLCDESAMTGETEMMEKGSLTDCLKKRNNIIKEGKSNLAGHHEVPSFVMVSGTMVQQGQGLMVITCVGYYSAIGRIRKTIADNSNDETPLQKKLTKIAEDIGKVGLVCAICTIIILIIRAIINYAAAKKSNGGQTFDSKYIGLIIQAFLIGITVVVVAIPEGLPLAVTLSLAYSVKKMLADKNLVRKLHACETMGGADVICSDKTGTLTQNKMFMTNFWSLSEHRVHTPFLDCRSFIDPMNLEIFVQATTCNASDDPTQEKGNPTDLAILKYLLACGFNANEIRPKHEVLFLEPFTSDRKRMSTWIATNAGRVLLHKGASEIVVGSCNTVLNLKTGERLPIDPEMSQTIAHAIRHFAKQSLRTIGIAFKYTETLDTQTKNEKGVLREEESGFTLIGVCGIKDIIRPEVPDAITTCNQAGITVKMVTGDNAITARAIAIEVNILSKEEAETEGDGRVMEGPEFAKITGGISSEKAKKKGDPPIEKIVNGEVFDKIYKKLAVLARSRPEDKYTMVTGLRERGHIVAVTGDGTNDAPALSKANVGFAMGIAGTEVAKQAAAIMLTDDNFTSIVKAVKWGRNIFDSIRKFLQFQLTVNFVAVVITFISSAVTSEAILSSVQMLWVNMIMDTLASLALATESPTDELLKRKPNRPEDYIVNKKMVKHILGQGILQIAVMMFFLFVGPTFLPDNISIDQYTHKTAGGYPLCRSGMIALVDPPWDNTNTKLPSRHFTYNFNVFVWMQIFNFVNARKLEDEFNIFSRMFESLFFPIIVFMIIVLQIIIVTFGGLAFRLTKWVSSLDDLGRRASWMGHLHRLRLPLLDLGNVPEDH